MGVAARDSKVDLNVRTVITGAQCPRTLQQRITQKHTRPGIHQPRWLDVAEVETPAFARLMPPFFACADGRRRRTTSPQRPAYNGLKDARVFRQRGRVQLHGTLSLWSPAAATHHVGFHLGRSTNTGSAHALIDQLQREGETDPKNGVRCSTRHEAYTLRLRGGRQVVPRCMQIPAVTVLWTASLTALMPLTHGTSVQLLG